MSTDITGLQALVADLARVGADLDERTHQVVSRGALNIKRDWRANARASSGRHARLYPSSIGYDPITALPGGGASAVIGPDKDAPQGALGNLLEFGSAKNGPHNDGGRALAAEEPRFIAAVEQLAGDLL
ncbi:hypothetical protein [Streptomyces sp. CB03911]|uniref:hypothetical protein n=1 Tax=Streptomyces sp. CB03911 TaxID=1804758 RepID=UPI00093A9174|nr:hypothetical protein [Streptomyces sp. CB03911]OKI22206.1 hypothetical protein A6A07_34595 [Streptomyces sp. CB03911]